MTATKKFTTEVPRTMTPAEAREKCAEMGLDEKVTRFVVGEFEKVHNEFDHEERCNCKRGRANPSECPSIVGDEGRVAWGQSWEYVYSDLAEAMGVFDSGNAVSDPESHPEVERVWKAFFEE